MIEAVGSEVHHVEARRPRRDRVDRGVRALLVLRPRRGPSVPQCRSPTATRCRTPRTSPATRCSRRWACRASPPRRIVLAARSFRSIPTSHSTSPRSVGCGVATGAGAALNTAPVAHGSSVAVIGLGGVGLASLMASAVRGAADDHRRRPRRVPPRGRPVVRRHARWSTPPTATSPGRFGRSPGVGAPTPSSRRWAAARTIETAIKATRRGGTTCVVGAAMPGDMVSLSAYDLFMNAKTLVGCQYGSVVPGRDFPMLLDLWRAGRLPLERLITRRDRARRGQRRVRRPDSGPGHPDGDRQRLTGPVRCPSTSECASPRRPAGPPSRPRSRRPPWRCAIRCDRPRACRPSALRAHCAWWPAPPAARSW